MTPVGCASAVPPYRRRSSPTEPVIKEEVNDNHREERDPEH
jgi:hypothetical protein